MDANRTTVRGILHIFDKISYGIRPMTEEKAKETYLPPVTIVFGLETKKIILVGSGGSDPLIPEDI